MPVDSWAAEHEPEIRTLVRGLPDEKQPPDEKDEDEAANVAVAKVRGARRRGAPAQLTASLIAFTGLALTALLAGLAANVSSCFVNGLMPLRAGRAGFFTTTNLAKP